MRFKFPRTSTAASNTIHGKGNFATGVLPLVCFLAIFSCGSSQDTAPQEASAPEPVQMAPAQPEPAQSPEDAAGTAPMQAAPADDSSAEQESSKATSQMDTAGQGAQYSDTVWAPGKEQALMLGLDGGLYEPYRASVVREVQQELKSEGYYDGPISGVVDEQTMGAIGKFQDENGLQASGVPTPLTREELFDQSTSSGVS